MGEADLDLFDGLPPELLEQLLQMGTLDERGNIIDQQLQQAIAQGQPMPQQHSTGLGAALGGLGNVIRGVGSEVKQHALRGQQSDVLGQKDSGRSGYVKAMVEALRRKQLVPGSAGAGDLPLIPGMG